jgi:ribosome biogenesis GTPase / thiamine phosphate phosphatase
LIDLYGWRESLGPDFAPHAALDRAPGRVIVQQRGCWTLATDHGELEGRLSGRFQHEAQEAGHPVAGDWVALSARPEEGAATIHAVLPRRTAFVRRAADGAHAPQVVAANADLAFLVLAMNGDFNLRRLERYLAAAWQSGAEPVVVLTKADLAVEPAALVERAAAVATGAQVLSVSALTGEGVEAVRARLDGGRTGVVLGSSGTGKSTLVNVLAGAAVMAQAPARESDARGRHTTTHRELVRLPGGGLILDTPGMRELGLMDAEQGLSAAFDDVGALAAQCRFSDCCHGGEPGCAVRAALAAGELAEDRWRSFAKLQRELAHEERKEDRLARQAERRRWAAISKANRVRMRERDRW